MFQLLCLSTFVFNVRSDNVFTNTFCDIRFKPTFIDKTLLIHEVLKHKCLFINAPYNFGKSANIGMFSMFFSNLRTKETIQEYFNNTEIWKDKSFVREHMGEYPVILYNTTVHQVVYDEDHMKIAFKWTLHNTFLDHEYLLKSKHISKEDLKILEVFLDREKIQSLEMESALQGLSFLAHALYQHHEKPVILLSDGFGHGIVERIIDDNDNFRYLSGVIVKWYDAIINNTLRDDVVIAHAVVSSENQLYGLSNNIFTEIHFLTDKKFRHFYGFTYDELEKLLCKYNIPLDQRPQVLKWYCGYSSVDTEVKVCNPYSILQYLKSPYKIIKRYWSGSPTGPDLLQRMVNTQEYSKYIVDLVRGRSINVTLHKGSVENVKVLRKNVEQLSPSSKTFIFMLLLEAGYLTFAGCLPNGAVLLVFPNEEIRSVVDKLISLLSFI